MRQINAVSCILNRKGERVANSTLEMYFTKFFPRRGGKWRSTLFWNLIKRNAMHKLNYKRGRDSSVSRDEGVIGFKLRKSKIIFNFTFRRLPRFIGTAPLLGRRPVRGISALASTAFYLRRFLFYFKIKPIQTIRKSVFYLFFCHKFVKSFYNIYN